MVPLIEYSIVGSGVVTLTVPVGAAQVACVVTVIAGAAGGAGVLIVTELLAVDTQVLSAMSLAVTV